MTRPATAWNTESIILAIVQFAFYVSGTIFFLWYVFH